MEPLKIKSWILLSIYEDEGDLTQVIRSADYVNRAIPLLEELNSSLNWLLSAGLIEINKQYGTHEFKTLENQLFNNAHNYLSSLYILIFVSSYR